MITAAIIIFYILIIFIGIKIIRKKKENKKMYVFIILLLISFAINIMLSLGMKVPNPLKPTEKFIKALLKIKDDTK